MKYLEKNIDNFLKQIINAITEIDPRLIIVFGSYSKKMMNEDSDLDLIVVLNTREIPKSYDDKIEIKLKIRKLIRDINKKVAIDLLVYTIPEYEALLHSNSSFARELMETGKVLYEKAG